MRHSRQLEKESTIPTTTLEVGSEDWPQTFETQNCLFRSLKINIEMPSYEPIRKDSLSSEDDQPSERTLADSENEFLQKKEYDLEDRYLKKKSAPGWLTGRNVFYFHGMIILLYTLIFSAGWYKVSMSKNEGQFLVHSPANVAIEMEKKTIYAKFEAKNPYKGHPSEALDHAWHQLFVNSNIRVSAEDLAKINRTSVPINDEKGGYYAIPDVYHQLHCLKYLRQVLYGDYYDIKHPDTKTIHIDHCIDSLRQNIMCKGDVTLLTFSWDPKDRAPKPNFELEHQCVDWEKLDDWAKTQRFDIFDETTLQHPTLGPSFPAAEYNATGRVPGHPDFRPNHYHGQDADDLHGHGGR
ncbi:hypothetical protein G7Y89_g3475 [Cudoniella acicularis]|uniref:Tat pathway signal sequence n=1 Tax=Cudoniella acicularis TaxID=354080 RepID=A0A8H4RRA3_9HELO|nr:hypothetical protein G7Y89_g3475 [Cudoniella acicularis]